MIYLLCFFSGMAGLLAWEYLPELHSLIIFSIIFSATKIGADTWERIHQIEEKIK